MVVVMAAEAGETEVEGVAARRPDPVDDAVYFRFPSLRHHHHDHLVRLQS